VIKKIEKREGREKRKSTKTIEKGGGEKKQLRDHERG